MTEARVTLADKEAELEKQKKAKAMKLAEVSHPHTILI